MSEQILFEDFLKVDMRVGKIIAAEDFLNARKAAYKIVIDFGEELGIKRSSAQITKLYTKEELLGMLIIAAINFPPRQIADFLSEVLVLGIENENKEVVLLIPDKDTKVGARIS